MKRLILLAALTAVAMPMPVAAQDTIVVTGSRQDRSATNAYFRSGNGGPAAIGVTRRADYFVTPLFVSSDSRDPDVRLEELFAMLGATLDKAEAEGIALVAGSYTLAPVTRANMRQLPVTGGNRPDTSRVQIYARIPLSGSAPSVRATAEQIKAFVKAVPATGRSFIDTGSTGLAIDNPEQYRAAVVKHVAEESTRYAAMFGSGYGVEITGLAGELYWQQSREMYFAGKAAMIIWSPFILDELAGLRDSAPPTINDDPTSPELASKTGIVTTFGGPSNAGGAAWADIRYFGITSDANTDVASEFVTYSMKDGYTATLSIAPEGKFPVRRGEVTDTARYVNAWSKLPVGVDRKAPLSDFYDAGTIRRIVGGLETADRWGVAEGQLSLASKMINTQLINRVVRQYIDDEISASEAVAKMNEGLGGVE